MKILFWEVNYPPFFLALYAKYVLEGENHNFSIHILII